MADITTQSKLHGPARRQQRREEAGHREVDRTFRSGRMQRDELSCRLGSDAERTSEYVRLLQDEADANERQVTLRGGDDFTLMVLMGEEVNLDPFIRTFFKEFDPWASLWVEDLINTPFPDGRAPEQNQ